MSIAYSLGEPAGIGADLLIQFSQNKANFARSRRLLAITDPDLLLTRAKQLGASIRLCEHVKPTKVGDIAIQPVRLHTRVRAGVLNPDNSHFVLEVLDQAIDLCRGQTCEAMLTGPIHKGVINEAGIHFSGHTEYLAQKAQCKTVMLLAAKAVKVAVLTTHIPLNKVSEQITPARLKQIITIMRNDLTRLFGIAHPKIAVCGLNPHAGENGHMGQEEIDIINPTLDKLRKRGFNLSKALPADSIFTQDMLSQSDAILAMYHDQGLAAFKALAYGKASNITLGLPFIRVSVDHGTALELAGSGQINLDSFKVSLNYIRQMQRHVSAKH